jgi:hypothetical protein
MNVLKLSTSGVLTVDKRFFEKVQHYKIPESMYKVYGEYNNYYYDLYIVSKINNDTLKVEMTDILTRNTKFLSFPGLIKKNYNFINIHIPIKIHRSFNKHLYWSIENFEKENKCFYIKKRSFEEYQTCKINKIKNRSI